MAMDWFQQNAPPAWPNGGGIDSIEQAARQRGMLSPQQQDQAAGQVPGTTTGPPTDPNSEGPGGMTGQGGNGGRMPNGAVNWGDLQSRLNGTTDIAQWIRDAFQAQGKTASDTDINYWTGKWNEFGKNDPGYFFQKFSTPDTGGQGGGQGGGPGGFGSGWNTLPTADQLKANPGFQYALDEAQRGMQNSAAAKGTLLNGRTNQAMSQNLANYALGNFYLPLANLGLNYNQANQDNLYRWGQLGLNGSSVGATGRPA